MSKKLIWDVPTRLFHWLLVGSLIAQYLTAEVLENAMQWHFYFGYFTLGLVIFRTLWGFIGSDYAKFSQFIYGPKAVIGYASTLFKRNSKAHAGHNPLGGWVVLLMLLLVLAQAISGLFMTDDIFFDGPWRAAVEDSTLKVMGFIHHNGFDVLLGIIALHIAAIGFYSVYKKQRLAPAMIHGKKDTNEPAITSSKWLAFIIAAAISAGMVYYVVEIAPPEVEEEYYY
ncbi:cytochrome b/b6 domain-containing protein [Aestuariibacter sp. A3R04]|uniref:cytochrome b/b6 domain-containing protein n=1 Tax=Aestuariibacter sp. A3R04 TaxID=2841571 RepID=UPI001C09B3B8|nr:cytochrome b/b6 domain-containing protein [Aestuariibacter sp. A3R04]MBU3022552.1 cytochrome b/b6 domain-containing protein [Aestuariibacter sp. A3R04]